jgi:PKD repeat protein
MKFKLTALLAAVVVAMGLLPGTSAAQAATVIKVAAEGDTLSDETVLKDIWLDGGVAINLDGLVAFGGRDGGGIDAVFTQRGKVVAEGETVGGTILGAFRPQGEVAINAGQLGDTVAFHGIAIIDTTYTPAVFTQSRKVAAVGDPISINSTLHDIDSRGKVAINYWSDVAFHGTVKIKGDIVDENFRAVFISEGGDTLVVAREDTNLPDETYLANITESGGVAISDFDEVAFHGDTGFESGSKTVKAVFTQNGLIAKEGDILTDGTTLENINENGGVAINYVGEVAFHGQAVDPAPGSDSVKAVFVFNQDGSVAKLIAKEGDILPDRTPLDEIEVSGGVAINLFGDVVFHGRTGVVKAVFTQNGLVAKVGDILPDDTTLSEINDIAGVAINPYGSQVAFHGKIGTTDAVFVGSAPDEALNNPPVADFSFTTDGLKAKFTDLSTDPDEDDIVAWLWDFGEIGATSRLPNPDWDYIGTGTYDVTLIVWDNFGAESLPVMNTVEVTEPLSGVFQVFVTSEGYQGDLGGLAGADQECQLLAEAAGLPGTWTAWLSDDNTDARDRIRDGQYEQLFQDIVADNLADLTDGSLNAPINYDENRDIQNEFVWTGTQSDGTRTEFNCNGWTTAADTVQGTGGVSDQTDEQWTDEGPQSCSEYRSLYCFSLTDAPR